jgi:hypothetical protein
MHSDWLLQIMLVLDIVLGDLISLEDYMDE